MREEGPNSAYALFIAFSLTVCMHGDVAFSVMDFVFCELLVVCLYMKLKKAVCC